MEKVLQFLKENPLFFLATEEGDQPRVRPFGEVCEFKGRLYLLTNNQKKVYRQIQANPKIELCGVNRAGDWLRVKAKAIVDESLDAKAKMLEDNPDLQDLYAPDDGYMTVMYLKDAAATFSSFTKAPVIVKF